MVDVVWPTSTSPGRAPGEGMGRLINCYAASDGGVNRWRSMPGLDLFATLPAGSVRGWMVFGSVVLAVVGKSVLQIDAGGTVTLLEEQIPGDQPVTMERNNNAIPTIAINAEAGAYVLDGQVVKGYPDTNLPVTNSVAFFDGYFLWTTAGGVIWASGFNVTTINALSYKNADAKPDGLLRGIASGSQYYAMGEDTIEVYQDAGTSPFPLSRVEVIPVGLMGQWAVTGYQEGWSGPLAFIAKDNTVRRLDGYSAPIISTPDIQRLIRQVKDKRTLNMSCYTFEGNSVISLSSPDWTWEYLVGSGNWQERESYGLTRWKGGLTIQAFGKWLVADQAGGAVYALNADTTAEGSDPLIWGLDSAPVKQFPSRIAVPGAAFDFVLGEAALGQKPQAMLSWSHDGGGSWANPVTRSLQPTGRFAGRVSINRMGLSTHHGIRLRFRVSDKVYTSFSGARMDAVDRK